MTSKRDATQPGTGLIEALHVTGPAAEHAGKLMLFGRFVGSWCLEWTGPDSGGQPATMTGELHFGWVLGGRAVQDIWIVPGRGEPGEGQPPLAFHGSTIRFYDSAIDAWRSTWIEPVNGRVRRFTGRADGSDIVLLSDEDDPQLRWRFTDITADSFTWRAESSRDAGASWNLDEQMLATRDNSARARTLPKPQCLRNASEHELAPGKTAGLVLLRSGRSVHQDRCQAGHRSERVFGDQGARALKRQSRSVMIVGRGPRARFADMHGRVRHWSSGALSRTGSSASMRSCRRGLQTASVEACIS